MKKILKNICLLFALSVMAVSCDTDAEYITYDGGNYTMFSDTLYELPVQDNETFFELPVVATKSCDYDRVLAVEVVDSISNAIEGLHYKLKSNTVVIPAGKLVGNVEVCGYHKNIEVADSLGFALRLIGSDGNPWSSYGTEANVLLKKACDFDIHAFEGYCTVVSTFLQNYTNYSNRVTYAEVDTEEENTIVIKDYFYDGYDVKIKFTTNDILNPLLKFEEQEFGPTDLAFGTKYGEDGIINLYQPTMYISYYSSCETFIWQYMSLYVPSMAGVNVVGTFINVVEWISADEAAKLMSEGSNMSKTALEKLK